jgi:hypothetical protein
MSIVTNTPHLGETPDEILAHSIEGRVELKERRAAELSDTSVNPIDAARERTSAFVHNICMQPLLELQKRQDEISNAVARIRTSERALIHYVGEFAKFCAEAEQLSSDIRPIIETLVKPFSVDPPATITQLKNGKGDTQ